MSYFCRYTKLLLRMLLLIFLAWHCFPVCASAQERQISENQAKAAFVYNAAYYVSWPEAVGDVLLIGVAGKGMLEREWLALSGKAVNGVKIRVIRVNDNDDLPDCHIVVIDEINPKRITRILSSLKNKPVLTIGDSPSFISLGGIVNLTLVNNRITFTINRARARANGLEISSNLLKLATEVIQ